MAIISPSSAAVVAIWGDAAVGSNCTESRGWPSRSGIFSCMPSNESSTRMAVVGSIAFGQFRRATSQTVIGAPEGSDRIAMKIGSDSTTGFRCDRYTSR